MVSRWHIDRYAVVYFCDSLIPYGAQFWSNPVLPPWALGYKGILAMWGASPYAVGLALYFPVASNVQRDIVPCLLETQNAYDVGGGLRYIPVTAFVTRTSSLQ